MKNLTLYNQKILVQYYKLEYQNSYSYPLLVRPNLIKYCPKIMYIDQETNTWFKDLSTNLSSTLLEEIYHK